MVHVLYELYNQLNVFDRGNLIDYKSVLNSLYFGASYLVLSSLTIYQVIKNS
jgi:hypothetical protein